MGRKRRDPEDVLGPGLRIRLTERQRKEVAVKATAAGISLSEFIRDCALANRTMIVARRPASADRKLLLYAINKIGNNLNQLAHAAHLARLTGMATEATYLSILHQLQWIEMYLQGTLGRVD